MHQRNLGLVLNVRHQSTINMNYKSIKGEKSNILYLDSVIKSPEQTTRLNDFKNIFNNKLNSVSFKWKVSKKLFLKEYNQH